MSEALRIPGRRWPWFAIPVAVAVASRAYSLAILGALTLVPGMRRGLPAVWDAAWYLRVARSGYHAGVVSGGHDFAFFPAWPLLVKVASLGVLPSGAVATLLANALFVVAAVLIWRVLDERLGRAAATGGVALLAFAPPAYVLSLPYSEPLSLAATAAYFGVGPASRWRLPAAALAMFARIAGAAVVASALARAAMARGRERWTLLAAAAAGTLAFAIWWGFIAHLTGQFTGFLHGSPSWAGGSSGLVRIGVALARPTISRLVWLAFLGIMAVGAVGLMRADLELAVFSVAALALALLPGGIVSSMPRYALAAFPAFGGLALLAQRLDRRLVVALAVVFAVGQVLFAAWAMAAPPLGAAP